MKIARYNIAGNSTVAVDVGKGFIDYSDVLEARGFGSGTPNSDPEKSIIRMIKQGLFEESFVAEQLDWARKTTAFPILDSDRMTVLLPLRPTKVVCVARNYKKHAEEQGVDMPSNPVLFVKTENCVIGPNDPIKIPDGIGRVDPEGELGVVISRKAQQVDEKDAGKYIFGYTIINDVTAREFQRHLADNKWPWYMAKAVDGFAPIGPWIVTPSEMGSLSGKGVRVTVNGELRQDGLFDQMHWGVAALIAEITKYVMLQVGDMVATGTPSGIAPIVPGDEVTVEVDGIGRLVNPVMER